MIRKAQEKLSDCRNQYRADKANLRNITDMAEQERRRLSLELIKGKIEDRVAQINDMVSKVKQLERKLKGR